MALFYSDEEDTVKCLVCSGRLFSERPIYSYIKNKLKDGEIVYESTLSKTELICTGCSATKEINNTITR